jgi:hypothetical protein
MAGSLSHRHQTAIASTGADVDKNEWNDTHVATGGVDGQFMQRDSLQADGWKWADSGVPAVAGALSWAANAAITSPVNLTTLGTIDWWAPTNNTAPVHLQTQPYPNRKVCGGALLEHWWTAGPGLTLFTGGVGTTISATAADSRAGAALAAFATGALAFNGAGGAVGYGWGITCRASQTSRVLHIGHRMWSGTCTLIATLSDGSASPATTTLTAGPGAGVENESALTFNCSSLYGAVLSIDVRVTTNSGSSPHLGLIYAYI